MSIEKPEAIVATWTVELNCDCPHCGEYVNLLDDGDFWDGRRFKIAESRTPETKNVEVWCPECSRSFEVNLAY